MTGIAPLRHLLRRSEAGTGQGEPLTHSPNYEWLDGVRGVAAQVVLLSHAASLLVPASPMARVGSPVYWSAAIAVIFFFVLSGFVIGRSISREISANNRFDLLGYGLRRAVRIYPPYLAALALVALIGPLVALQPEPVFWQWPRSILFIFTGQDAVSVMNGPVWSLRIEVGLYVVAALVACAAASAGATRIGMAVASVVVALIIGLKLSYGFTALAMFSCGAAAAIRPKLFQRWLLLALPVVLLPLFWQGFPTDGARSLFFQSFFAIPIAAFLIFLTGRPKVRSGVGRMVVASGRWSYTLYIVHYPLLLLTALLTLRFIESVGVFVQTVFIVAVFVVINAVAYVMAGLLEQPSLFAKMLERRLRPVAHEP